MTDLIDRAVTNGTVQPHQPLQVPPAGGLRMPRRTVTVEVPEYDGFTITLWVNYPRYLNDELRSGDNDRMRAALCQVVLAHNGWCQEDGTPLPPPSEAAFWDQISDELAAVILTLQAEASSRLPNSVLARSRR